jgi:hypothetical protein
MSVFCWVVFVGAWLLAGAAWCVLFAALGLRYEVDFESSAPGAEALNPVHDDLAAAA